MENIIDDMITSAYRHNDYEMASMVYKLMYKFADTVNCPSNWRDIGEVMAEKYNGNNWIEENCKLYEFR